MKPREGARGFAQGWVNEIYLTFILVTIGGGREAKSPFAKMGHVVMSLFVLVAISMYTANLASMLTIDAQKIQRYNNLHEIIQAGEQVCVQEVRTNRTTVFSVHQDKSKTAFRFSLNREPPIPR